MNILVQKFGGTSLESKERMNAACDIVKKYKKEGKDIVVVVSAMGRCGAPYATDTLINLCKDVTKNPSKRELDLIMSCGEVISGCIFVSMLKEKCVDAVLLNASQAGIITDDKFCESTVIRIENSKMLRELESGNVVVVTGFQGISEDGDVTTLGRGGSDTSAVIIGKSVGADIVEIYTDVNGIMTADPKMVPGARTIENLNYDEVFQMAEMGAKVIHPRAVEVAKSANITLKIKNTLSPSNGSTICACISNQLESYKCRCDSITAIAHENDVVQIIITQCTEDLFTKILNEMCQNDISIDMINFFVNKKAFTIKKDKLSQFMDILGKFDVEYKIEDECTKVTLIGSKMNGIPGVMAKIVNVLLESSVEILQTSDSHMTISCLIKKDDSKKAISSLHKAFEL